MVKRRKEQESKTASVLTVTIRSWVGDPRALRRTLVIIHRSPM